MIPHFQHCQLFGGAFQAQLPSTANDLSLIVPVPDNQEVYTDSSTGATLIMEILEMIESDD